MKFLRGRERKDIGDECQLQFTVYVDLPPIRSPLDCPQLKFAISDACSIAAIRKRFEIINRFLKMFSSSS
jgi:hypothetical protein